MADKVAAALGPNVDAARSDLNRRRELNSMTKAELVDYILGIDAKMRALSARIEAAYGLEP